MDKHRLRELRNQHNYTQEFVANELGMSQSAYSRIERNDVKLFRDTICALKKLYGVSGDYIMGEDD